MLLGNTRYVTVSGRRHRAPNEFRRLGWCLRQTGIVMPTVPKHAGRVRTEKTPANEDAITASVEREPWERPLDVAQQLGRPNTGSWIYFMTIICIHTNTHGMHICFKMTLKVTTSAHCE
jgi:hypothetical protein